ncbi:ABC transporter C family member 8 [Dorcoceras hygrometricum]|uniref:ABC transporter C family member 8 n=1 Tax=Dorcoceras hygrometricum TaxID=472368 RepID=A0A2Z7BGZ9_9LAMI|nr:ABC transporter C family member 8 [Dorcoceras hygrometricum]
MDLGDSKAFTPLKILTAKTVGTYVAKNKNITTEEVVDEPQVEKVAKNAAAKRRPAPVVAEPAKKKKKTVVGRAAPTEKSLALRVSDDEKSDVEDIIAKVINETAEVEMEETETMEPMVMETAGMEPVETESRIDVSAITNYDAVTSSKVLSNEEGPLVETEKEKENRDEKVNDSKDTEPLSKVLELTETSISDEESMSIDEILQQIPEDMMLPSVSAEEPTKIQFGRGIQIREGNWYKVSLPKIAIDAKGKEPLVEEVVKGHLAREMFLLISADIEFLVQLREAVIE